MTNKPTKEAADGIDDPEIVKILARLADANQNTADAIHRQAYISELACVKFESAITSIASALSDVAFAISTHEK